MISPDEVWDRYASMSFSHFINYLEETRPGGRFAPAPPADTVWNSPILQSYWARSFDDGGWARRLFDRHADRHGIYGISKDGFRNVYNELNQQQHALAILATRGKTTVPISATINRFLGNSDDISLVGAIPRIRQHHYGAAADGAADSVVDEVWDRYSLMSFDSFLNYLVEIRPGGRFDPATVNPHTGQYNTAEIDWARGLYTRYTSSIFGLLTKARFRELCNELNHLINGGRKSRRDRRKSRRDRRKSRRDRK